MTTLTGQRFYAFNGFYLDTVERRLLSTDGESIPLSSRAFDVLHYLVRHPGEIIDKGRLMAAVWPNTIVEENNLNQAIAALRKALGETPELHRFILTIPGRGYRFIPEVKAVAALPGTPAQAAPLPENEDTTSSTMAGGRIRKLRLSALTLVIGAVIAVWVYLHWDRTPPHPAVVEKPAQVITPATPEQSVTVVGAPLQSVAVLPFVDMSPNQDQEYFADGIAEEMINKLAQLKGLHVAGRTSSFYFKDRHENFQVIGEKLGVSHILEGSVRKEGNQVRITAQLVKAADGYHLWSQSYDRTLEEIFTIQDDIARTVANALEITLGVGELGHMPGMTRNVTAYDQALLARAVDPYSPEGLRTIIEHLERAVELDPEFGLIWLDLGIYYSRIENNFPGGIQGGHKKAEQAFERARELTPDSPFVLHRMVTRSIANGDWLEADRLRQESIKAAATYSLQSYINGFNASFLHYVGRSKEAVNYYERIRASDPLNIDNAAWLTEIYAYTGDFAASFMEADRGMALEGAQQGLRRNALLTALASGDRIEIEKRLALVLEIEGNDQSFSNKMRQLLDDPVTAIAELHRLGSKPENQSHLMKLITSQWAAYFGDPEYALEGLQDIAEGGGISLVASYSWHPIFREMRRLEGFKDLILDIGLAEYWRTSGKWSDFCQAVGEDDFECR
jgi:TolB-like protein/DNA-binding winged helix-turn-helix (wHTH) protein